MGYMSFLPMAIIVIFYLAIIGGIIYMIYTWVNKFIVLKQEHNDLLREIVKKMDSKLKVDLS